MNKQNITKLLLIISSTFLFVSSSFILIMRTFLGFDFARGTFSGFNLPYLQYFTSLSNFYNGFVFLAILIYLILNYHKEHVIFPKWLKVLALSAVVGVAVTFFVTVTFLVIVIEDKSALFAREILFLHIINPLISVLTYIFLMQGRKLKTRYALFGFIPLTIYAIFYSIFVVNGIWADFYNFTFGGHYWVALIALPAVIGIGYLFSFLLIKGHNKYFYPHKYHALILLGGKGNRMGNETPKQFLMKNSVPLYIYTVRNYSKLDEIDDITLVVAKEYVEQVKVDVNVYNLDKVKDVVIGGSTRVESSFNGISFLMNIYKEKDYVLIADAVRVNTSEDIIFNNILALRNHKAVLTAIEGPYQKERIDTSHYKNDINYLAQTPQSFNLGYINYLYQTVEWKDIINLITDDINLVEINREDYYIVLGDKQNYKITVSEDLKRFLEE